MARPVWAFAVDLRRRSLLPRPLPPPPLPPVQQRELVRLCFEDLGLRRVTANCFADNEASWRLMERIGMRREPYTVRDSLHRSGEWLDGMGYALLADEWRKTPALGSASSGV